MVKRSLLVVNSSNSKESKIQIIALVRRTQVQKVKRTWYDATVFAAASDCI